MIPNPVDTHMNLAADIVDEIDPGWTFMNPLDLLDVLAIRGIALVPDFDEVAAKSYEAGLACQLI